MRLVSVTPPLLGVMAGLVPAIYDASGAGKRWRGKAGHDSIKTRVLRTRPILMRKA